MMGDGVIATGVTEIPDYDEVLDEAFTGPDDYNEEDGKESYDDGYWEESQALIEATFEGTDNTQHIVRLAQHIYIYI